MNGREKKEKGARNDADLKDLTPAQRAAKLRALKAAARDEVAENLKLMRDQATALSQIGVSLSGMTGPLKLTAPQVVTAWSADGSASGRQYLLTPKGVPLDAGSTAAGGDGAGGADIVRRPTKARTKKDLAERRRDEEAELDAKVRAIVQEARAEAERVSQLSPGDSVSVAGLSASTASSPVQTSVAQYAVGAGYPTGSSAAGSSLPSSPSASPMLSAQAPVFVPGQGFVSSVASSPNAKSRAGPGMGSNAAWTENGMVPVPVKKKAKLISISSSAHGSGSPATKASAAPTPKLSGPEDTQVRGSAGSGKANGNLGGSDGSTTVSLADVLGGGLDGGATDRDQAAAAFALEKFRQVKVSMSKAGSVAGSAAASAVNSLTLSAVVGPPSTTAANTPGLVGGGGGGGGYPGDVDAVTLRNTQKNASRRESLQGGLSASKSGRRNRRRATAGGDCNAESNEAAVSLAVSGPHIELTDDGRHIVRNAPDNASVVIVDGQPCLVMDRPRPEGTG